MSDDQRADYEYSMMRSKDYGPLRRDVRRLRDEITEKGRLLEKIYRHQERDLCRQWARALDKILAEHKAPGE